MHTQVTVAKIAVPPTLQTSAELSTLLGCEPQWIEQHLGVRSRYIGQLGDDPAALAASAARAAIEERGIPDLILYASATVRQFLPDTSVFVAQQLDLSSVACFSIHATCLSFLVALHQAALLVSTGQYGKVLIVCAELASLSRNMAHRESAGLLGDGAAAVMVEPSNRSSGMQFFKQLTWPEYAQLSQIRGGGLLKHPESPLTTKDDYLFEMDGEKLLRVTMPKLKSFLQDMFQQLDMTPSDIDWVLPHQASASGLRLVERLGFAQERIVNILSEYGNCVSASMPMALAEATAQQKIKPGDKLLFLGSAAGLSLGAAIWQW